MIQTWKVGLTSQWPWDNPPMEPNTNRCHHVYLDWIPTDLLEVLVQWSTFNHFELIWTCCDLEMTLSWPWDNSPMKPNTYSCHHVYLAWVSSDLLLYHPRVKGTILRWPVVTFSMYRKSAGGGNDSGTPPVTMVTTWLYIAINSLIVLAISDLIFFQILNKLRNLILFKITIHMHVCIFVWKVNIGIFRQFPRSRRHRSNVV